jgi:hypothetical protein
VLGQGSKDENVVHPFSLNARLISKLPHNTKKKLNQKIAKKKGR